MIVLTITKTIKKIKTRELDLWVQTLVCAYYTYYFLIRDKHAVSLRAGDLTFLTGQCKAEVHERCK